MQRGLRETPSRSPRDVPTRPMEIWEDPSGPPLPPGGRECVQRRRRKRPWALLALALAAVAAFSMFAVSFYRIRGLGSELAALRSEIFRRTEEEQNAAIQQDAKKPGEQWGARDGQREPEMNKPKSQQGELTEMKRIMVCVAGTVLQPCLQMIGDKSGSVKLRDGYTVLPWQVGLRRGTALQEEENTILVREGGFYFVYSQVYYTDKTFAMGHVVLRRKESAVGNDLKEVTLFRCVQNMNLDFPFNTCYAAGIARLEAGDRVELLIPRLSASVSLDGDSTFFGAVRLA